MSNKATDVSTACLLFCNPCARALARDRTKTVLGHLKRFFIKAQPKTKSLNTSERLLIEFTT